MHIDEHLLERYLLNPQDLPPDQQQRIETHLEECPTTQAIFEYLKDYYSELEQTPACRPVVYDYFVAPGAAN